VWGQGHYTDVLDTLGCAGVPVKHPVSGQTLGVLELTMEQDAVVAALRAFGGNRSRAATSLSMSRATIYRKVQQ
jgi:transcriptional regulator of acetoin/glycerol metabolism